MPRPRAAHRRAVAGCRRYRRHEKGEIDETDDHLMRATGWMLVHGLGLGMFEAHAASDDQGFDPVEYVSSCSVGSCPQGYSLEPILI